jgi:hypothetical protein
LRLRSRNALQQFFQFVRRIQSPPIFLQPQIFLWIRRRF